MTKYLIDTHTFIWFVSEPNKLSKRALKILESSNSEIYLSIVSAWEIAIKYSLGKIQLPSLYEHFIKEQIALNEIELLNLRLEHTVKVASLPFVHSDPFDRALAAQALSEETIIVSKDPVFSKYQVRCLW